MSRALLRRAHRHEGVQCRGLARWLTADPAGKDAVHLNDPQTWNLCAYVSNNPLTLIDPTGLGTEGCASNPSCWRVMAFMDPGDGMAAEWMSTRSPSEIATYGTGLTTQDTGMWLSSKGLDFIKKHEWLRLKPYKDQAGKETIGYGHKIRTGEDFSKDITKAQALRLLKGDVRVAVNAVNAGLDVPVARNQFDALVSLAFNAGPASVLFSNEMMSAANLGWVHEENFTQYDKITVNGKLQVSQALLRRREEEWAMFSGGGP